MTDLYSFENECSLCGVQSYQMIVSPIEPQGLPDLDTRPAEMVRSTLPCWVQRCPHCGYCATDIALDYPLADQTIRTEEYQRLLRKRSLPEKARQFLAWALIQVANDELGGAGWSALHAAWICDDDEKLPAASDCRRLALERFTAQRARQGHVTGFEEPGVEELLLADLNRRTGSFAEANRWASAGMGRHPMEMVRRALRMEQDLAERKDRAAHSVQELLDTSAL
jgi:hypothetical protein